MPASNCNLRGNCDRWRSVMCYRSRNSSTKAICFCLGFVAASFWPPCRLRGRRSAVGGRQLRVGAAICVIAPAAAATTAAPPAAPLPAVGDRRSESARLGRKTCADAAPDSSDSSSRSIYNSSNSTTAAKQCADDPCDGRIRKRELSLLGPGLRRLWEQQASRQRASGSGSLPPPP